MSDVSPEPTDHDHAHHGATQHHDDVSGTNRVTNDEQEGSYTDVDLPETESAEAASEDEFARSEEIAGGDVDGQYTDTDYPSDGTVPNR